MVSVAIATAVTNAAVTVAAAIAVAGHRHADKLVAVRPLGQEGVLARPVTDNPAETPG